MSGGPLELLARARTGHPEALGEICNLYRNYLRMVVRTGLGPKLRELVELSDVVQERCRSGPPVSAIHRSNRGSARRLAETACEPKTCRFG